MMKGFSFNLALLLFCAMHGIVEPKSTGGKGGGGGGGEGARFQIICLLTSRSPSLIPN